MDSGLIVPVQLGSLEATERLQYERYKTLVGAFAAKYGKDPEFVSRAPGRVNLIGEHIDYCGYSVLPMALTQDLSLAVGKNTTTTLRISNVDGNFSEFDGDISTFTIDSNKPAWYNYVLCGIKGVTESHELTNLTGLNIMVDGTVPQAAGLSSSSALVCSAGLATAHVFNCNLSRLELADICMKCERYIGTQGGGMDQSISFLAQHGTAKLISFNPLQATSVALPSGSAFVVSNSLVRMKKADTAHFNTRVVECKLAAQILAAHNSLDRAAIKTLRDVQQLLDVDFDAMLKMVDSSLHDDPYTVEEVAGLLSMSVEDLKSKVLFKNTSEVKAFKLKQRATHVFAEAQRVFQFKSVCSETTNALTNLGKLMNESHESCSGLYQCSCLELDQLTQLCRTSGAHGSRLTGAGWGGCAVSLVPVENLSTFIGSLRSGYYGNLSDEDFNKAVFSTSPGGGAAIYLV